MNPLDAFYRILALLHRAALDDAHWPAAAALIDEACGAEGTALVVGKESGGEALVSFARYQYRGEFRDDFAREYFEDYYAHDEGPPRLREKPFGQLIPVPDLYTATELRASRAYNESWHRRRAQNGLIAHLDCLDGQRIVWNIANPVGGGGWQSTQLRLIESLLPHVGHLVRVRQALASAEALSAGLAGLIDDSGIGVLHMDRGGRVLAANEPALDILRLGRGLSDRDGALHASVPADDRRLQRLLQRALPGLGSSTPATGGWMRIQRPRLRSQLELHVHPVDAERMDFGGCRVAALILVVDPESPPRLDPGRVATMLGLSPSEGRVAALLAEGLSVREIAAITSFKETYVRWLLHQASRNQGVSGQGALVRRVLTACAFPWR